MSRVVTLARPPLRRAAAVVVSTVLVVGAMALPVVAQDLPTAPCSAERSHDCWLSDWTGADHSDIPSLFGEVEGITWVEDAAGDAPEGGLDILAAGIGRVTIDDPASVRKTAGVRKQGKIKKAVPAGTSLLVRIVLDRALDDVPGGHASVHVATDVNGSRTSNVPSGVAAPDFPFAGSQDVYSLTWASTTGKTRLLNSDLAKAWYKAKDPFAAGWAAPNVLDLLIKPSAFGEDFRVITHAAGGAGGYDTLTLGPAAIPTDGRVGLLPACIEGSIMAEPFVVSRLVENGQVVRNVEAQASWRGGASVPLDGKARAALADLIAAGDDDGPEGDDRITVPAWVNLFEDGIVIRQRTDLELALWDDDDALLSTELGLTRRGYNVLRDFEPDSTGDRDLDAWLESATDALRETMPPWRLSKRGGVLVGEAIGACIPWFVPPAELTPDPTEPGSDSTEASVDAAAAASS